MKRLRRALVLGCLGSLLLSCHQTYTGIYFLDRSRAVSSAEAEEIASHLAARLAAYGFAEARRLEGTSVIAFSSGQRTISPELRDLAGSDARISVAVRLDHPSITIRDFSSARETAFVRALKDGIEAQLEADRVLDSRFERQQDFWFF